MTYTISANPNVVIREADQAYIPSDPRNTDYQEYQRWIDAGNTPAPYTPTIPARVNEALDHLSKGLTVSSTANSSLNGTYNVVAPDNLNLTAIVTSMANRNGLPFRGTKVAIFDNNNVEHMFAENEVSQFSVAFRDFVHATRLYSQGKAAALPPNVVALAAAMLPPACSVFSGTSQPVLQRVPTKIMFNAAEFDTTGAFNLTTATFQPKVAGYYQISCGAGVDASWVLSYTSIYKNGREYRRATTAQNSNTRLSTLVRLNGTTDYVEGYIYSDQAGTIPAGGVITSLSAALVVSDSSLTDVVTAAEEDYNGTTPEDSDSPRSGPSQPTAERGRSGPPTRSAGGNRPAPDTGKHSRPSPKPPHGSPRKPPKGSGR